jgi:hypothetical protein
LTNERGDPSSAVAAMVARRNSSASRERREGTGLIGDERAGGKASQLRLPRPINPRVRWPIHGRRARGRRTPTDQRVKHGAVRAASAVFEAPRCARPWARTPRGWGTVTWRRGTGVHGAACARVPAECHSNCYGLTAIFSKIWNRSAQSSE